jgi:uncharacterized protein YndB with AHSA1/START domain
MFVIVQLVYETWGRKEMKREWWPTISKYITSVQEEDITICVESC